MPGVWDLRLASPAKINLYLRVMRRRDDGFHELESLFQAVSLHDTLRFRIKRREGGGTRRRAPQTCSTVGLVPLRQLLPTTQTRRR